MRMDKLTLKAQEAVQMAQGVAERFQHSSIDSEHLLVAMVSQESGITGPILDKVGAPRNAILSALEGDLARMAKVQGGSGYGSSMSKRVSGIFNRAFKLAEEMKDDYVSVDHFLLAISEDQGSAGKTLRQFGASQDVLRKAIEEVRGGRRGTTADPEGQYRALEKYGIDLTARARAG